MLDNVFLEEEVNFLRSKIKALEEKIKTLEKDLNESRACRIRLVDEAQKFTDRYMAIVTKNSSMVENLIVERKKILDLVDENKRLKYISTREQDELKKIKDYYELALIELDETNRGFFEIIKEFKNEKNHND